MDEASPELAAPRGALGSLSVGAQIKAMLERWLRRQTGADQTGPGEDGSGAAVSGATEPGAPPKPRPPSALTPAQRASCLRNLEKARAAQQRPEVAARLREVSRRNLQRLRERRALNEAAHPHHHSAYSSSIENSLLQTGDSPLAYNVFQAVMVLILGGTAPNVAAGAAQALWRRTGALRMEGTNGPRRLMGVLRHTVNRGTMIFTDRTHFKYRQCRPRHDAACRAAAIAFHISIAASFIYPLGDILRKYQRRLEKLLRLLRWMDHPAGARPPLGERELALLGRPAEQLGQPLIGPRRLSRMRDGQTVTMVERYKAAAAAAERRRRAPNAASGEDAAATVNPPPGDGARELAPARGEGGAGPASREEKAASRRAPNAAAGEEKRRRSGANAAAGEDTGATENPPPGDEARELAPARSAGGAGPASREKKAASRRAPNAAGEDAAGQDTGATEDVRAALEREINRSIDEIQATLKQAEKDWRDFDLDPLAWMNREVSRAVNAPLPSPYRIPEDLPVELGAEVNVFPSAAELRARGRAWLAGHPRLWRVPGREREAYAAYRALIFAAFGMEERRAHRRYHRLEAILEHVVAMTWQQFRRMRVEGRWERRQLLRLVNAAMEEGRATEDAADLARRVVLSLHNFLHRRAAVISRLVEGHRRVNGGLHRFLRLAYGNQVDFRLVRNHPRFRMRQFEGLRLVAERYQKWLAPKDPPLDRVLSDGEIGQMSDAYVARLEEPWRRREQWQQGLESGEFARASDARLEAAAENAGVDAGLRRAGVEPGRMRESVLDAEGRVDPRKQGARQEAVWRLIRSGMGDRVARGERRRTNKQLGRAGNRLGRLRAAQKAAWKAGNAAEAERIGAAACEVEREMDEIRKWAEITSPETTAKGAKAATGRSARLKPCPDTNQRCHSEEPRATRNLLVFPAATARLKPCPDTKRPPKARFGLN